MTIDSSPIVLVGPEGLSRAVSALGLKPRKKAIPRLEVPAGPIARYGLRLGKVLEQLAKAIGPVILEELEGIVESTPAGLVVRQDVGELLAARAQSLEIVAGGSGPLADLIRGAADDLAKAAKRDQDRIVKTVLGVRPEQAEPWLQPLIDEFIRENARLITRVNQDFVKEVERAISEGQKSGARAKDIEREIRSQYTKRGAPRLQGLKKRLRLIARDQLGSLTGDITRARQTNLGVTRFRWRTSRDERVRPSHKERDGEVFLWGESIEKQLRSRGMTVDRIDGVPGKPINCRCYAEPVLDDLGVSPEEVKKKHKAEVRKKSSKAPASVKAARARAKRKAEEERRRLAEELRRQVRERRIRYRDAVESAIEKQGKVKVSEMPLAEREAVDSITLFTSGKVAVVRRPGEFRESERRRPVSGSSKFRVGRGEDYEVRGTKKEYETANRVMKDLAAAPATATIRKTRLYRGHKMRVEMRNGLDVGSVFDMGEMASFSGDATVAENFALDPSGEFDQNDTRPRTPVIWKIRRPLYGTDISNASRFETEDEVITSGEVRIVKISKTKSDDGRDMEIFEIEHVPREEE